MSRDCTFELSFNGINQKFNSEKEFDDFIRNNPDTFNLEGADDFRFSKDLGKDNSKIIWDTNERIKSTLSKVNTNKINGEDLEETYTDETISVLQFVENYLTDRKGNRFSPFNEQDWENNRKRELFTKYSSLPELERNKKIEETIQKEKKEQDQIRKLGKGIHILADKIFNESFTNFKTLPNEIRAKASQYTDSDIGTITDDAIIEIAKGLIQAKKRIIGGKKFKHIYTEMYMDYKNSDISVRGKMDAVIIYEDGSIDLIDFKLSSKDYSNWDGDKKNKAESQLQVYETLLEANGVKAPSINSYIVPIYVSKMNSDSYNEASVPNEILMEPNPTLRRGILNIMNIDIATQPVTEDLAENTVRVMSKMMGFDVYNNGYDEKSFELLKNQYITKSGNVWKFNPTFVEDKSIYTHSSTNREEVEEGLKQYLSDLHYVKVKEAKQIVDLFKRYKNEENPDSIPFFKWDTLNKWMNSMLTKYIYFKDWEVIENESLLQLGVIGFRNNVTKEIDLVSISYEHIDVPLELEYGNTILGHHYENEKTMLTKNQLKANLGNIELLKLLYLSNQLSSGYKTGELKVLDIPQRGFISDRDVRDKLEYNYNILANTINIPVNKVSSTDNFKYIGEEFESIFYTPLYKKSGFRKITKTELSDLYKSMKASDSGDYKDEYSPEDLFSIEISKADKIDRLLKLRNLIQSKYYSYNIDATTDTSLVGYFFYEVNRAIGILKGVDIDSINKEIFSGGYVGGSSLKTAFIEKKIFNTTLLSTQDTIPIADAIYERVSEVNGQIRTEYMAYKTVDRKHLGKFKEERLGLRNNQFINNPEVLYKTLLDKSNPNELMLKDYRNDPSLTTAEKNFIKWYLNDLNKYRFGTTNIDEIEGKYGYDSWRKLPLLRARFLSRVLSNRQSLGEAFKSTAGVDEMLDPKGTMSTDLSSNYGINGTVFDEYFNGMKISEDDGYRRAMIEQEGIEAFDINLERIKDMYTYATIRAKRMNPLVNTISASLTAFAWSSYAGNKYEVNKPTIDYIVDFIKSSVLDLSLIEEDSKNMARIVSAFKSTASKLVLGLNVLSMLKEGIVGWFTLYNNALANQLSDKDRFNIKEASKAYALTWGDGARQMFTITLGEHLNAQYGIANMSEAELVDRLNYYQGEIGRFNNLMFLTARAPDFLHRVTIFTAYMLKDNCYKAHSLKDGHIEYDWRKDGRFNVYAKYRDLITDNNEEQVVPKSELEIFRNQRALYLAMKEQMIQEGALVVTNWETGEVRKMTEEDDLPKAYTQLEANKMIQESNIMFGYMDNTNKSLYLRKGIGLIIGQFQSYLSAKRSQYFLSPGIYNNGHWVNKKDPVSGKQLYRGYDENGKVIETTENTGMPIKYWEGSMMEGIFWSVVSALKITSYKDFSDWKDKNWDNPTRRRNFMLLFGDLGAMGLLYAIWYALYGELKESEMNYLDNSLSKIISNASNEFNLGSAILGQLDFQFTSLNIIKGFLDSLYGATFGETNFPRAITSNVGALKPFKPMIYDMFPVEESE